VGYIYMSFLMAYYYSWMRLVSGSWLDWIASVFYLSYYSWGGFACFNSGDCGIVFY
jgi:hypothetical protein